MSYRSRAPSWRPTLREIYEAMTTGERVLFWLAMANFLVFVAIAVPLGGDALDGTARDGRYFLVEHGIYTEVRRPVFIYSMLHTLSLFVTQPIGIFVALKGRSRALNRN